MYSHLVSYLGIGQQKKTRFTIYMLPVYTPNTMPADALATLGATASAGMALTPTAWLFHLQHQKS